MTTVREEIILGISPLDCDVNVSLLRGGEVLFAAGEERFTRVKQQAGFPHRALQVALETASLSPTEITGVAYPFLTARREAGHLSRNFLSLGLRIPFEAIPLRERFFNAMGAAKGWVGGMATHRRYFRELNAELTKWGLREKLYCVPHHLSHVGAAYYFSGFPECLAIIVDGYGTGLSSSIWVCRQNEIRLFHRVFATDSLGDFYASLTHALGFKANRHEGKILGLSALGDPSILRGEFEKRFSLLPRGGYKILGGKEIRFWVEQLSRRHSREVIAAAAQETLEKVVTHFVRHAVEATGISKLVLAGGVVANVKLNQRLYEMPGVSEIFVFPAMSDAGTGVGAGLLAVKGGLSHSPVCIQNVYWGPGFSEAAIERVLRKEGYAFSKPSRLEETVAGHLAQEKIVGWFDGRMEFGPRALGHRSILAPAIHPEINKTLNDKLKRSEFMPFAPVTLFEKARECYLHWDKAGLSSQFMTTTFSCTEKMKSMTPAVVHVDTTARPQVIRRETNPRYYAVLEAYHQKTGIPSLINTSMNIHEEPIVCSPEDALRTFQMAGLDALVLGPFLVLREANQ